MLEKINAEELDFMETLCDPVALAETLWHDFDNLQIYSDKEFGTIRLGQLPMLSYEYIIDDGNPGLSIKENFKLLEGAGSLYNFGARKFGKSLVSLIIDMLESIIHLDGWRCLYSSYDALHILQILERVVPAAEKHPFLQLFNVKTKRTPNYTITAQNGFEIQSVNMNITSKTAGANFFGHHTKKLWVDEYSKCTSEVEEKLIDATSELGCIERFAGMTDFTRHSPAGKIYDDYKLKPWVVNFPQYISPMWDDLERLKQERRYGGTKTVAYRTFVKGEICEDGISVFDMDRVRANYDEKKVIKNFEINKDNFKSFKQILVVDRPKNAALCIIGADIGETAPTEIVITFKINDRHNYMYNVTLYNLTDKQQYQIFKYLITILAAEITGIDCGDGSIDEDEFVIFKLKNKIYYKRAKDLEDIFTKTKTVQVPTYNLGKLEWKPGTLFKHTYSGKMLEFQSKPGSGRVKVTPNHSMMVFTDKGLVEKKANEVKIGDWLVSPKNDKLLPISNDYLFLNYEAKKANQFSKSFLKQIKLNEDLAYLLGWFAAEGCYKDKGIGYQLTLGNELKKAKKIQSIYKKLFKERCKIVEVDRTSYDGHYIGNSFAPYKQKVYNVLFGGGKGITKLFADMVGVGSNNKKVPIEILNSPKSVQEAFLQGVLEGDGIGGKRLKVKSEELVYGVSLIVKMLGFYPTISKIEPKNDPLKRICWSIEWNNINTALVGRWLGVPSKFTPIKYRGDRKWYNLNEFYRRQVDRSKIKQIEDMLNLDFVFRQVSHIREYDYEGTVYDFCVKDNNTFCAGNDNIIVHNTGRSIYRRLEEDFTGELLFYYEGSKKIAIGYKKDADGRVTMVNGKPELDEEFMSEWSVKHLKTVLYDQLMVIPQDFKFDTQINSVIALTLSNRTVYECVSPQNHLFDAFKVWALSQWKVSFNESNVIKRKCFSKRGC